MPVSSQPPPSEQIPEHSGGGLYLAGAVVLVGAAVALFSWKRCNAQPATSQATSATATATVPPKVETPAPLFAPPPPPKVDEDDAGVDAGKPPPRSNGGSSAAGPSLGPCGNCVGEATGALQSALSGRASSAKGCYNRALRTSEVSGSMTVSVQVGPGGQVCSASLTNDSVHSNEIANCVLGKFRGQTFPPPSGGCVTVNIPINFTLASKP